MSSSDSASGRDRYTTWLLHDSRKTPTLLALFAVVAIALTGCGESAESGSDKQLDANGCTVAEMPAAKSVDVSPPSTQLDPNKTHVVTMSTNCGEFKIKLDAKNNPRTASSFAHLVEEGVYDGTWFHRIVPDFVIQGGDPNADGSGGSGYDIVEPPTGQYRIGTVAMAKTANDPAGNSSSQFYVVIGEDGTDLPPDYAIAGDVSDGEDVIERIARYAPGEASDGAPSGVAIIEKASVSTSE
ncbi:MAG: peptidylprolyl isomerase [Solirubrobacterales bacterium]